MSGRGLHASFNMDLKKNPFILTTSGKDELIWLYFLMNRVWEQDGVNDEITYFLFSLFFIFVNMFTYDRPWSLWNECERGVGTDKSTSTLRNIICI